jgi:hypothetical protein
MQIIPLKGKGEKLAVVRRESYKPQAASFK